MESKGKRFIVWLVFLLSVVSLTSFAGNTERIGTAGATELLIPVGARSVALVGQGMIFDQGAEAMFWNPAGLGRMDRGVEALVSQMSEFNGEVNITAIGIGISAGDMGTLGFSLKSLSFGDIPVTTVNQIDGTGETYSPTDMMVGVTYAKGLTDRVAVGITATLVSEKIQSSSATGIAFNIGVQYRNLGVEGLDLGVVVKNIGPSMTYSGSSQLVTALDQNSLQPLPSLFQYQAAPFDLPSSMEVGIGYTKKLDDKNSIMGGGTFRNNNYQDDEYLLGAEYSFDNLLFLRGGYDFSPQTNNDVTGAKGYPFDYSLGAGVHTDVGGVDLAFDYAFQHMMYFTGNHIVSLRLGF